MPTESAPLCDGAKIDTTEAANAPVQKPFPEQSRAKTDVIHQFFDPQDVGCIKAAANGTMSHGCGSTAGKDLATKQAMFEELGKEFEGDPTLLGIQVAPKDIAKVGTTRKPLSFDDPNEENADEEDASDDEEYNEDDEDEEQDDEDEEQGDSEDDEDDHEKKHHGDDYEDDDEFSEPPAKKKK